jgi:hypothetical protein
MRWAAMIVLGLGLGLASGAAAGCPHPRGGGDQAYESQRYERWNGEGLGGYAEHSYPEGYDDRAMVGPPAYAEPAPYDDEYGPPEPGYDLAWAEADGGGWYMHGLRATPCVRTCRPQPPCDCLTGSVGLSDAFFADAGGVGPIPADVYYGGGAGFGFVGGGFTGASSRAFASASARTSTSVSIRSSGGYRGGGHHGAGGKGGGKHH